MAIEPTTVPSGCPDANLLGRYVEGVLPPAEQTSLESHLDGCVSCTLMFRELGVAFAAPPTEADDGQGPPGLDDLPDRFTLLYRVGAGGMAEVFAVDDRHLGRTVALKVFVVDGEAPDADQSGRRRFLREAQVLARLDHDAILAVHDIIETPRWLGLVMPLVAGHDARTWIAAEQPDWLRVVEVYRRAAQGLAAAHQAGVVHRDVKPDNILVGHDGRVRVADFGLARVATTVTPRSVTTVTRTGMVMGTPGYMAPEQLAGKEAGPAADVFGLCVAIWEGIVGRRPFTGRSIAEQAAAIVRGVELPADTDVPRSVLDVVARGLAAEPADRWPSMETLAAALRSPAPDRARWGRVAGLGGALLVVGLVAATATHGPTDNAALAVPVPDLGSGESSLGRADTDEDLAPNASERSNAPREPEPAQTSADTPPPEDRFKPQLDHAGTQLTRGDPEGCLQTLKRARAEYAVPQAFAMEAGTTEASCMMAVGQCDQGRRWLHDAHVAAKTRPEAIERLVEWADALYCPLSVPGTPNRRLARLDAHLHRWVFTPDSGRCVELIEPGLAIYVAVDDEGSDAQPPVDATMPKRVAHSFARCLASEQRCAHADAMWMRAVELSHPTASSQAHEREVAALRGASACAVEPR